MEQALTVERPALQKRVSARRAITEHTRDLLLSHGIDVPQDVIAERGAVATLYSHGVPRAELGVPVEILLVTGHAGTADIHRGGLSGLGQAEAEYATAVSPEIHKAEPTTPGAGIPGAVPIRPAHWDFDKSPAMYKLAMGDTLVGLATTYLGDGGRWKEWWQAQPDSFRATHTPSSMYAGTWLIAPADATATALAAMGQDPSGVPGGKPQPVPPSVYVTPAAALPGGPPPWAPSEQAEPWYKHKYFIPAVAATVVVGGLAFWALA